MSTSRDISVQDGQHRLTLLSLNDFIRFGEFAAASSFAPKDMRGKPQDCALAVMLGAEIGLPPMAALQGIAVVNGRPSAFGDALIAVVKASPVCEYVHETIEGEGDNMVARCEAKRQGYPDATVVTFGVADAKRAKLWGKEGPWTQYPRRMLQMRARGFALRDCFPDILRGVITREEAEDYPADPPKPQPTRKITKAKVVVDAEPVADTKASADEPVKAVGILEKALALIASCDTFETLADFQDRADAHMKAGRISQGELDQIVAAIDQRADYLRSVRQLGGPPSAEE